MIDKKDQAVLRSNSWMHALLRLISDPAWDRTADPGTTRRGAHLNHCGRMLAKIHGSARCPCHQRTSAAQAWTSRASSPSSEVVPRLRTNRGHGHVAWPSYRTLLHSDDETNHE